MAVKKDKLLTIARMTIRNYLVITEWAMKLGKMNRITAANRRGKTATLRAVKEALISSGTDPSLIHDNEDEAEIIMELTDGVSIERKITATGNKLKVTVDDQRVTAPTRYIKEVLLGGGGGLNFDPTEYFLGDEATRREMLLKALPITVTEDELAQLSTDRGFDVVWKLIKLDDVDFDQHGLTVLNAIKKLIFERRAEQNLHVNRLTKALELDRREIPETIDTDTYKGFKLNEQMDILQTMERLFNEHNGNIDLRESIHTDIDEADAAIESSRLQITEWEEKIAEAKSYIKDQQKNKKTMMKQFDDVEILVDNFKAPDIDAQRAHITGFEASQEVVLKLKEIERRATQLEADKKLHFVLDEFYKYFNRGIITEMIGRSELTIEGVSLDDKGNILIHNRPLNKLSDSEQITLAVDIAEALVGKLGVICVDRLEALDGDSLKEFEARALKSPCQFITCKVGTGNLKLEKE